ncbi:MAG: hypothetical protein Q8K00_16910 [Syntrophales bacterium]|nr:hypothetical protein [Syntrophales bacterium]
MMRFRNTPQSLLTLYLLLIAIGVFARIETAYSDYEPVPHQDGKDVVWVPTAQALADKMLDLAKVTSLDYVIDLGSGEVPSLSVSSSQFPLWGE